MGQDCRVHHNDITHRQKGRYAGHHLRAHLGVVFLYLEQFFEKGDHGISHSGSVPRYFLCAMPHWEG